jgi:hypothetical protein
MLLVANKLILLKIRRILFKFRAFKDREIVYILNDISNMRYSEYPYSPIQRKLINRIENELIDLYSIVERKPRLKSFYNLWTSTNIERFLNGIDILLDDQSVVDSLPLPLMRKLNDFEI